MQTRYLPEVWPPHELSTRLTEDLVCLQVLRSSVIQLEALVDSLDEAFEALSGRNVPCDRL